MALEPRCRRASLRHWAAARGVHQRTLIRARHRFLEQDKPLEDWELLGALDGTIVPTDDLWQDAGLPEAPTEDQTLFRWVVGTYLSTRLEGGGLALGPAATD